MFTLLLEYKHVSFFRLFEITKNTNLNLKDLSARNQSVLYSSSIVPAYLLLFTCSSAQTLVLSADHDFNIPKNKGISE